MELPTSFRCWILLCVIPECDRMVLTQGGGQASVTLFDIFLATIFIACYGLSPVYVIVVQSILTIFWVICFGLLLRALGESMTASCSVDNWGNGAGARVCHLFKMLVAFSLFSILSLVAMLVAAVVVRRRGGAAHGYSPTANSVRVGHKATATATVIATDTVYHPPPADGAPPPAYSPPGTNAAAAAGP